jgi:hypothetical protein
MYFEDPWVLPSPCESIEGLVHAGMAMPLSATEITYRAIQQVFADIDPASFMDKEEDQFPEPIWAHNSSTSLDFLDIIFPYDEAIIEAMTGPKQPWEDMHHRSYFLPELQSSQSGEL